MVVGGREKDRAEGHKGGGGIVYPYNLSEEGPLESLNADLG